MKKLVLLVSILALFVLGVGGCSKPGLKTGFVYCCTTQADGTKKCVQMGSGDCKNTAGATIVNDCATCK